MKDGSFPATRYRLTHHGAFMELCGLRDYSLIITNEVNAARPHSDAFVLQGFGSTERGKTLWDPTQM